MVTQITSSIKIISAPVLMSSMFIMSAYSFVLTGVIIVTLGIYAIVVVSSLSSSGLVALGTSEQGAGRDSFATNFC